MTWYETSATYCIMYLKSDHVSVVLADRCNNTGPIALKIATANVRGVGKYVGKIPLSEIHLHPR